jgi:hypothetical protein
MAVTDERVGDRVSMAAVRLAPARKGMDSLAAAPAGPAPAVAPATVLADLEHSR